MAPLGSMPPSSALAGLTVFPPGITATATTAAAASARITSWINPPLPALLPNPKPPRRGRRYPLITHWGEAGKQEQIQAVRCELLSENMALQGQLDDFPTKVALVTRPITAGGTTCTRATPVHCDTEPL